MFDNFLLLKEINNINLYVFINKEESFDIFYFYYKKNDFNTIIYKACSYAKTNNKKINFLIIVLEGVIVKTIKI